MRFESSIQTGVFIEHCGVLATLLLALVGVSAQTARADGPALDATERQRVFHAVLSDLRQYYFDHNAAERVAKTLLAHESAEGYATNDPETFANRLTKDLRAESGDMHLEVVYSQDRLPNRIEDRPPPAVLAQYRKELEQSHCTIAKIETLPRDIGYLKLDSFPDPAFCEREVREAMAALNHARALIFDLRDNRGGSPAMVMLVASYLFNRPEYMFSPREAPSLQSWTKSPVPANELADKPVFILTSRSTISAAEQFTYDMKMLKRATLVGETTRGGAHAGVFHRIDDHFGMGISEVKTVNPFAKNDWEGTGVEPDIKVAAGDALETAKRIALNNLSNK